jgi:hypothetical protein
LGLHYKIVYKKGVDNQVADALSRRVHDSQDLQMISSASPQWLQSEALYGRQPRTLGLITPAAIKGNLQD